MSHDPSRCLAFFKGKNPEIVAIFYGIKFRCFLHEVAILHIYPQFAAFQTIIREMHCAVKSHKIIAMLCRKKKLPARIFRWLSELAKLTAIPINMTGRRFIDDKQFRKKLSNFTCSIKIQQKRKDFRNVASTYAEKKFRIYVMLQNSTKAANFRTKYKLNNFRINKWKYRMKSTFRKIYVLKFQFQLRDISSMSMHLLIISSNSKYYSLHLVQCLKNCNPTRFYLDLRTWEELTGYATCNPKLCFNLFPFYSNLLQRYCEKSR